MKPRALPAGFVGALGKARWPGNVRQLFNCLERTLVMSGDSEISFEYLPEEVRGEVALGVPQAFPSDADLSQVISKIEVEMLRRALEKTSWNKSEAARLLGIPEPTIRYKVKKYGLFPYRKD